MGPKLCDVRTNVPVDGSNRYVKPEAGDGSGRLASCVASATSNCSKFDWKALLKCPECVEPSGRTASLSTTRPFGPNRSSKTCESVATGCCQPSVGRPFRCAEDESTLFISAGDAPSR